MSLEVGSIVEGTVTGITNFGVFIQLPGGEIGLVHISEIADTYVKDINDYLQKRDNVKVKILCIDQGGKIGLSIKQANKTQKQDGQKQYEQKRRGNPGKNFSKNPVKKVGFEDKLVKFFKDSDERQQDLKKNTEAKRGGRGTFRQEV